MKKGTGHLTIRDRGRLRSAGRTQLPTHRSPPLKTSRQCRNHDVGMSDRSIYIRPFLAVAVSAVAILSSGGCVTSKTTPPTRFPQVYGQGFPEAWAGRWQGPVQVMAPNGPLDTFTMQLDIGPTDDASRFDWRMTLNGREGLKVEAYSLVVKDRTIGSFAIDENNGVVMDATWIDGTLYSEFEVGGSRIQVRYLRRVLPGVDELLIDMTLARTEDGHSAGGSTEGTAVATWPMRSVQRAVLRRVPVSPTISPQSEPPGSPERSAARPGRPVNVPFR